MYDVRVRTHCPGENQNLIDFLERNSEKDRVRVSGFGDGIGATSEQESRDSNGH